MTNAFDVAPKSVVHKALIWNNGYNLEEFETLIKPYKRQFNYRLEYSEGIVWRLVWDGSYQILNKRDVFIFGPNTITVVTREDFSKYYVIIGE